MLDIIGSIGSIAGCILVARGGALRANMVWSISNLVMIAHLYSAQEWTVMMTFAAYEVIAIYGIWNLTRRK